MIKNPTDHHLSRRLKFDRHPKRILCLDGGGIRGLISLEILKEFEKKLEIAYKEPVSLSEFFDLIVGVSTGSIIASGLALGKSIDEIADQYRSASKSIFKKKRGLGIFRPRHDINLLEKLLDEQFLGISLGSAEYETGLLILAKRIDQDGYATFSNSPFCDDFGLRYPTGDQPEKPPIQLSKAVSASCAAPSYFDSVTIALELQNGTSSGVAEFVDGAITGANNPAVFALQYASDRRNGLNWRLGRDDMLIVSVGTGDFPLDHEAGNGGALKSGFNLVSLFSDLKNVRILRKCIPYMMNTSSQIHTTILSMLGRDLRLPESAMEKYDNNSFPTLCSFVRVSGTLTKDLYDAITAKLEVTKSSGYSELLDMTCVTDSNLSVLSKVGLSFWDDFEMQGNPFRVPTNFLRDLKDIKRRRRLKELAQNDVLHDASD